MDFADQKSLLNLKCVKLPGHLCLKLVKCDNKIIKLILNSKFVQNYLANPIQKLVQPDDISFAGHFLSVF